jgi:hypothetical protein
MRLRRCSIVSLRSTKSFSLELWTTTMDHDRATQLHVAKTKENRNHTCWTTVQYCTVVRYYYSYNTRLLDYCTLNDTVFEILRTRSVLVQACTPYVVCTSTLYLLHTPVQITRTLQVASIHLFPIHLLLL